MEYFPFQLICKILFFETRRPALSQLWLHTYDCKQWENDIFLPIDTFIRNVLKIIFLIFK